MLKSIDLFSGIGGLTHGLSGICTPKLYCEIENGSRDVLKARMRDGSLPTAPIIKDVRKITLERLTRYKIAAKDVDIIIGGFPCQGFSNMGKKTGLGHVQSGLYTEIIRLVDMLQPKAVFLENVPNVLRVMLDRLREDFHSRGYCLAWTVVPASLVGAQHERARWFCLAFRANEFHLDIKDGLAYKRYPWDSKKHEPARMHTLADKADKHVNNLRLGMLGNSVVPDAVRFAFFSLVTGFNFSDIESKSISFRLLDEYRGASGINQRSLMIFSKAPPRHGVSLWTGPQSLQSYVTFRIKRSKQVFEKLKQQYNHTLENQRALMLNPKFNTSTENTKDIGKDRLVRKQTRIRQWSTPRHGNVIPSRHLTIRTIRDLPTQIRFETSTVDAHRYGDVNPEFVEFLMGYPIGWTAA